MSRGLVTIIVALAVGLGNACLCTAAMRSPAPSQSAAREHKDCCKTPSKSEKPAHHCAHCDGTASAVQAPSAKTVLAVPSLSLFGFLPVEFAPLLTDCVLLNGLHHAGLPPPASNETLLDLRCALNI